MRSFRAFPAEVTVDLRPGIRKWALQEERARPSSGLPGAFYCTMRSLGGFLGEPQTFAIR